MSMKEFKKRIKETKEQQEEKENTRKYINIDNNTSIFRLKNTNVQINWSNNINKKKKSYSVEALKEINLQDKIKGDKILLSRYCDTTNDFIVKNNLNNKIILETI